MAYGTVKVDNITFTNGGIDQTVTVSGIVQSISGNITATGTIQAATIIGTSTVSGATVTGDAGQFTTATITSGVFASGTAAAPSISVGTTDNGIYSPGTDQVAISTSGTKRIEIQSDGDVSIDSGTVFVDAGSNRLGVNTSNPAYELEVSSTGEADIQIDSGSGQDAALRFAENGTNAFTIFHDASASALAIYDNTALSQRITIDSDGKLGLGTANPGAKLDITESTNVSLEQLMSARGGNGLSSQIRFLTKSAGGGNTGGAIGHSDALGGLILTGSATSIASAQNVVITSAGNVGVGTTSPSQALHVVSSTTQALFEGSAQGSIIIQKAGTQGVAIYSDAAGTLIFYNQNGGSEHARIDGSGRLLVGTSTARSNFFNLTNIAPSIQLEGNTTATSSLSVVQNAANSAPPSLILAKSRSTGYAVVSSGDSLGRIPFMGADGSEFVEGAVISAEVDDTPGANDMPGRLVFSTTADGASSPTPRMTINSSGECGVFAADVSGLACFEASQAGGAGSTRLLFQGRYSATGTYSGTESFRVETSGDVKNTNGVYTTITSDERFKQDIVELSSQWDDIKGISLKKFRYKNDPTGELQLGVIAQELQQVCPGLVTTRTATEEDVDASGGLVAEGDEVLGWKMSVLPLKAVKALQEAMERIEQLEAKVAALEAQ